MIGPEQGFLLLTSSLGDPSRKPLTVAQFRGLSQRALAAKWKGEPREVEVSDLLELGYDLPMAERICGLLAGTKGLREYLRKGQLSDCYPITRLSPHYPLDVRCRLGLDSPGALWAKGDVNLLKKPAVAVIGSRDLNPENRAFAMEAGRQIARQGYVLVSGNARGADKAAQEAALEAGGQVISVVADSLQKQPLTRNVLYLSLDEFDAPFSAQRALRRNHVIHTLGALTIAAQCTLGKGGTWEGILANLRWGWNPVCIFDDGSDVCLQLQNRGARSIRMEDLENLSHLKEQISGFL